MSEAVGLPLPPACPVAAARDTGCCARAAAGLLRAGSPVPPVALPRRRRLRAIGRLHCAFPAVLQEMAADSQLEIAPDLPARLTLTYALGVEHGLYAALAAAPDNAESAAATEVAETAEPTATEANAGTALDAAGAAGVSAADGVSPPEPERASEPEPEAEHDAREPKRRRL